jgi:hypothetical protein
MAPCNGAHVDVPVNKLEHPFEKPLKADVK